MNLLLLAPDIQEEVLAPEYPAGREPITERTLRPLLASLVWEHQRALWAELRLHIERPGQPGRSPAKQGQTR